MADANMMNDEEGETECEMWFDPSRVVFAGFEEGRIRLVFDGGGTASTPGDAELWQRVRLSLPVDVSRPCQQKP